MIAVDTNILVYAHNTGDPHHDRAREALSDVVEGDAAWGLPVFVVGEFLRIVTNRRGPLPHPSTPAAAIEAIDGLLTSPNAKLLLPGRRYLPLLRGLIADVRPRGNEVVDAQVAAVCLEQGATTILTNDTDFRQFSGITVKGLG